MLQSAPCPMVPLAHSRDEDFGARRVRTPNRPAPGNVGLSQRHAGEQLVPHVVPGPMAPNERQFELRHLGVAGAVPHRQPIAPPQLPEDPDVVVAEDPRQAPATPAHIEPPTATPPGVHASVGKLSEDSGAVNSGRGPHRSQKHRARVPRCQRGGAWRPAICSHRPPAVPLQRAQGPPRTVLVPLAEPIAPVGGPHERDRPEADFRPFREALQVVDPAGHVGDGPIEGLDDDKGRVVSRLLDPHH